VSDDRSSPTTPLDISRLLLSGIVDVIDSAAQSTSPGRTLTASSIGRNNNILDTLEISTMGEPMEEAVSEDIDEADEWDYHGDSS